MQTNRRSFQTKSKAGDCLQTQNCKFTDFVRLKRRLYHLGSKRGFLVQKLGVVEKDPILLLMLKRFNNGPNLLIAAGFHGEEPAGSWAVLHFLETAPQKLISRANLSFLPVVNPTGFRSGKRENYWGEDPNRGFCHTNSGRPEPSREGLILIKHLPMLRSLAKDGFLSLHEDVEQSQFYIYTFENANAPGPFSETLRSEEAKFFSPYPDGILEGGLVRNGIIFRHCDGSFEDLLFHEGIHRTACTETPGLLDINKRVEVNVCIITAFVRFAITV